MMVALMMLKITKKHANINTLKSEYINFGDYFKKVATTFGPQPLIFAMTERDFFPACLSLSLIVTIRGKRISHHQYN